MNSLTNPTPSAPPSELATQPAYDTHDTDQWLRDSYRSLVIDSLVALLPSTLALVWIWFVTVIFLGGNATGFVYLAIAVTTVSAVLSYRLRLENTRLAVVAYVGGLLATLFLMTLAYPGAVSLCAFAVAVVVLAALTRARTLLWSVIVCLVLIAFSAWLTRTSWGDTAIAMCFVAAVALMAWLGARRLVTALQWTLSMTAEAQQNAAEARWHRGEMQRVLRNLDEAYVRLAHTNEALALAKDAAEKALRFKSDFVVNVSHELRTPLNLIIGFSEMMATAPESYGGVPLPKEYRGDVMATYRSAVHLADLINDVLDLSQIEAGRMPIHRSPNTIAEVIHESAGIVRGLIESRGLTCEIAVPDGLPVISMDRMRIRQVLLNLLSNASRFTDTGFIRTSAVLRPGQGTHDPVVVITVQDSGRGIPADRIDAAFEAFSQAHDSQVRDGSGIGLALSRQFVSMHGGSMWIESEVGRGTSVSFALPVGNLQKAVEFSRPAAEPRESNPLIVTLSDDTRAIALIDRYVDGFQQAAVASLEALTETLVRQTPVAIVVDSNWIMRHALSLDEIMAMTDLPLVQLHLPGARSLVGNLGVEEYLVKPITRDRLSRALRQQRQPITSVLIVDNDPHIVRLLARMLRSELPDADVREAFGGAEALDALRSRAPDVLLLDLLMPNVNGYQVIEMLRADRTLAPDTRVIVVSAHGEDDDDIPVPGPVTISRHGGYTATQSLHILNSMLQGARALQRVTPLGEVVQSTAQSSVESRAG